MFETRFLLLFRAIGHGAFGKVCEGVLRNMPGETTDTPVAVKVLYQLSVYTVVFHLRRSRFLFLCLSVYS